MWMNMDRTKRVRATDGGNWSALITLFLAPATPNHFSFYDRLESRCNKLSWYPQPSNDSPKLLTKRQAKEKSWVGKATIISVFTSPFLNRSSFSSSYKSIPSSSDWRMNTNKEKQVVTEMDSLPIVWDECDVNVMEFNEETWVANAEALSHSR